MQEKKANVVRLLKEIFPENPHTELQKGGLRHNSMLFIGRPKEKKVARVVVEKEQQSFVDGLVEHEFRNQYFLGKWLVLS